MSLPDFIIMEKSLLHHRRVTVKTGDSPDDKRRCQISDSDKITMAAAYGADKINYRGAVYIRLSRTANVENRLERCKYERK